MQTRIRNLKIFFFVFPVILLVTGQADPDFWRDPLPGAVGVLLAWSVGLAFYYAVRFSLISYDALRRKSVSQASIERVSGAHANGRRQHLPHDHPRALLG